MTKLTKKQQKIDAEKAALRRRVLDMAFGAFGDFIGADHVDPSNLEHLGMFGALSPDALGLWIGAVQLHLMKDKCDHLKRPHCLKTWDSLDELVDAMHRGGVRA